MKRASLLLVILCSLMGLPVWESQAEFLGKVPTGLLLLEKKYPYYLFVPPDYSPERTWPILLLLGKRGEDPKELIGPWVDWAKQKQFLVLAIPSLIPEKDIPEAADQWLLEVKREIGERYRIDSSQILLVGFDLGAHYAAYLGTRYPHEFSAAVMIREAWPGPFGKLIKPTSNRKEQVSFYVAVDPKSEGFSTVRAKALEFEKKGYRITFETLEADQDLSKLRDRMAEWFRHDTEIRVVTTARPKTKMKEKIGSFLHDFFEV